jgi:hypothetical protein
VNNITQNIMIIPLLRSDPSHVRQIRSVLTNLVLEGVALALTDGESLPSLLGNQVLHLS